MKTTERAIPELVQATRQPEGGEDVAIDADWVEEVDGGGEVSAPIPVAEDRSKRGKALKTVEIDVERDRRSTLVSPIPAMVAEWMRKETEGGPGVAVARDPAAPEEGGGEQTRRLGDSSEKQRYDRSAGYEVEVDDGNAEHRQRAARCIDRARDCLEAADLAGAVRAAEEAFSEADQAAPPGIVEVIEPARPMLTQIFAAFVGPTSEVPVLARRSDEIGAFALDERMRAVIAGVDGTRSLEQIFDAARIPMGDALRITATLMRAGIVRVV